LGDARGSVLACSPNPPGVPPTSLPVAALDAGPGQVGTLAFLLIGLPAGAWVDRMRHRRVLIVADLARTVLFASVPLAWWLDALTLGQL
jgi:hypothetical protein